MHHKRSTLLALATVGVLLAGCADDPAGENSAADAGFNAVDVEFAQGMIPHHAQAVEMARMVPGDGVSPELVELAGHVDAAQQPEIERMTAMLERWGEDVPPVGGDAPERHGAGGMEGMMSGEDMAALGAADGPRFERMWLTMMIEHHEGAITMSETELADGSDEEARTLAREIIDAQQAEITRMEQMLAGNGDDDHSGGEALSHIHGLGVVDDRLYVATHHGLFTVSTDGLTMASEDDHDFMGFTVADSGEFLASGHPNSRDDLPGDLGLLESTDGGKTWSSLSLSGEVDFHALDAKGGTVVGLDSGTGELLTSTDRESWSSLGQLPLVDVAISPAGEQTLLITTEDGPQLSTDAGQSFAVIGGAPLLLLVEWPSSETIYGVSPDGAVHHSSDGGETWEQRGRLGGAPQAMAVAPDGAVYVALESSIVVSADGGKTFASQYSWD